ncbi:hypothetical protein ABEB36_000438 [Hypothenemus hampei]|uniref:Uncharacterized protein n=1 Tax=Hypothenemus hampei TaxID=57062 RepID=A0ABD1FBA1_HYPHA
MSRRRQNLSQINPAPEIIPTSEINPVPEAGFQMQYRMSLFLEGYKKIEEKLGQLQKDMGQIQQDMEVVKTAVISNNLITTDSLKERVEPIITNTIITAMENYKESI